MWTISESDQRVKKITGARDVPTASAVLGIGTNLGYQLAAADEFPVRILRLGRKLRVPTAELLIVLGLSGDSAQQIRSRGPHQPLDPTPNAE